MYGLANLKGVFGYILGVFIELSRGETDARPRQVKLTGQRHEWEFRQSDPFYALQGSF